MTDHGFKVGNKVVSEQHIGGSRYYRFALVERATKHTVTVRYYNPLVRSDVWRLGDYRTVETCTFHEKHRTEETTVFRYQPSMGYMGKRERGSLMWHELKHFKRGQNYETVGYL